MIAIAWLFALSLLDQVPTTTRLHLPVTIKVLKDVPVRPHVQNEGKDQRGVIYIDSEDKGFVLKSGQSFEMTKIGQEGSCSIQIEKKTYEVSSCRWLTGFVDRQTDIFSVLPKK